MSSVLVLQHEDCEPLGFIEDALNGYDLKPQYIRAYAGDAVPETMGDAGGLVVLGGPQGAYETDKHPYLAGEIRLIQNALQAETPVLGMCLGAQLMAAALGARVAPAPQKEIGWYPVTLTEAAGEDPLWRKIEPVFMTLQWHGDIFDLPDGAVRLGASALTPNQAFRYGRGAYGVQWHMEMTEEVIRETAGASEASFAASGLSPAVILDGVEAHLPNLSRIAGIVFRGWAELVV
ncbi:GMP synthase [Capsulimonas corticalis]|uniref:GMP synthase n=1 Tax=Capsulimonas corticalis TaxID=2219043 RepID=A0A402D6Q1_9BACT|nr:gamma-glutamyl-gamma-aminobutyrate hydrolase family protein [Capsulimonas corticalis]BDI30619.1 GMP synthase [Capsulimonas corticalis]